jgi:hypothetical protein
LVRNLKEILGKENEFIDQLETVQKEMKLENLEKIQFYLKLKN